MIIEIKQIIRYVVVFVITNLWLVPVKGQEARWLDGLPPSNEQQRLLRDYVSAVNTNDLDKMVSLYYPDYSVCLDLNDKRVDHKNIEPIENYIDPNFDREVPDSYEAAIEEWEDLGLDIMERLFGGEFYLYPATPTHELKIGWTRTSGGTIIKKPIVNIDDKWYFALRCPTKLKWTPDLRQWLKCNS